MIVTSTPPTTGLGREPFRDTKLQYKYILVNHQSSEKLDVNYLHWGVDGDKYYEYDLFFSNTKLISNSKKNWYFK